MYLLRPLGRAKSKYGTSRAESDNINPLTPNDHYRGRTAQLTSKRFILYIYSTNIGTEYFKHGIYSSFFICLQIAICFIILFGSCIIHILYTVVLKLKKKIRRQKVNPPPPMTTQYQPATDLMYIQLPFITRVKRTSTLKQTTSTISPLFSNLLLTIHHLDSTETLHSVK